MNAKVVALAIATLLAVLALLFVFGVIGLSSGDNGSGPKTVTSRPVP